MSRAFVSDKETWAYCAKAGERCFHADPGKDCRQEDCPHYRKSARRPAPAGRDRTVTRKPAGSSAVRKSVVSAADRKSAESSSAKRGDSGSGPAKRERSESRTTKRANIKPPKKWGGRSG